MLVGGLQTWQWKIKPSDKTGTQWQMVCPTRTVASSQWPDMSSDELRLDQLCAEELPCLSNVTWFASALPLLISSLPGRALDMPSPCHDNSAFFSPDDILQKTVSPVFHTFLGCLPWAMHDSGWLSAKTSEILPKTLAQQTFGNFATCNCCDLAAMVTTLSQSFVLCHNAKAADSQCQTGCEPKMWLTCHAALFTDDTLKPAELAAKVSEMVNSWMLSLMIDFVRPLQSWTVSKKMQSCADTVAFKQVAQFVSFPIQQMVKWLSFQKESGVRDSY